MTRHPARSSGLGPRPVYPHLVVDWSMCEYDQWRIYPGERDCGTPMLFDVRGRGGLAALALRIAVVEHAVRLSAKTGRRLCAVFGPHDVVFVGPDGETTEWPEQPSDGTILDAFAEELGDEGHLDS